MSANAHGHTTAAWTGVGVSFLGFCVAAWGMVYPLPFVVVIGLVVAAAGAVVGKLMSAAGFGKKAVTHAVPATPATQETASTSVSA